MMFFRRAFLVTSILFLSLVLWNVVVHGTTDIVDLLIRFADNDYYVNHFIQWSAWEDVKQEFTEQSGEVILPGLSLRQFKILIVAQILHQRSMIAELTLHELANRLGVSDATVDEMRSLPQTEIYERFEREALRRLRESRDELARQQAAGTLAITLPSGVDMVEWHDVFSGICTINEIISKAWHYYLASEVSTLPPHGEAPEPRLEAYATAYFAEQAEYDVVARLIQQGHEELFKDLSTEMRNGINILLMAKADCEASGHPEISLGDIAADFSSQTPTEGVEFAVFSAQIARAVWLLLEAQENITIPELIPDIEARERKSWWESLAPGLGCTVLEPGSETSEEEGAEDKWVTSQEVEQQLNPVQDQVRTLSEELAKMQRRFEGLQGRVDRELSYLEREAKELEARISPWDLRP